MFVGGLDIGTTGAKLAVYNENVKIFDTFYVGYDVIRVNGNDEICFKTIFEKVLFLLKQASEKYLLDAIAVTTFGESFTMLDENDNILTPTMVYTDSRGENEIKEIVNVLGEKKIALKTGVKPHAMYSLAKVLWIKKNMPIAYSKAKRILLGQDYIVYMLSGVAQIDYSLAERTQYFNIESKKYDEEILEIAGIDKSYKASKMGNVTKFVHENPKSVVIFDEVEKAHYVVLHLFLQILDAGGVRDNYLDEIVSFEDTIIVFTSNAGRNLYEESEKENLATLPKKVVIDAIKKDTKIGTKDPVFPEALISRFSAGNVIMFNKLT